MRKFLTITVILFCFVSLIAAADKGSAVLKKAVFGPEGDITWVTVSNDDIKGKKAYVIAHGLYDKHNADWISNITKSYRQIEKDSQETVFLSVDWDKDSAGLLASTRINQNVETLAKTLAGVNIETALGHSYGTHLLAAIIGSKDCTATVKNFVALDPAEETLTLTGSSRDWSGAVAKTNVEVYKSSVFLGSEVPLGDQNFLLAKPGDISPQSLGGDWGGINPLAGKNSNHSLATAWYQEIIEATQKSSGWFSDQVQAGVTITDADGKTTTEAAATGVGTWTGVVNTEKYTSLDYVLPASKATGDWGDVFTEEGLATSDWSGTVLNPSHKNAFDSQFEVQTYEDGEGNKWQYDPVTAKTYKNGEEYTGTNVDLGNTWEDPTEAASEYSLTGYIDGIMGDLKNAGKDIGNDALDIFKETWKSTTGSIWTKLKSSMKDGIQGAINSLKGNAMMLIKKYLSLENLTNLVNVGLQKLLSLNSTVKKIFEVLGLNNINNIVGLCKDIFKLVKGLLNGGSFLTLLRSSVFLKNMAANLIKWGVDLLKNLLSGLLSKVLGKLVDWTKKFVNKVLGALGIKASIDFQKLLSKGIDAALNAGTKWVKGKVDGWAKPKDTGTKTQDKSKTNSGGKNVFAEPISVTP